MPDHLSGPRPSAAPGSKNSRGQFVPYSPKSFCDCTIKAVIGGMPENRAPAQLTAAVWSDATQTQPCLPVHHIHSAHAATSIRSLALGGTQGCEGDLGHLIWPLEF